MEKDEKIVVEELEEQAEPKQEKKAELGVQSFEPSQIGGMFFTKDGLTIFPKAYMEKFAVEQKEGLIGEQSQYDYSQVAGALGRVVTLEKENHDLTEKVSKLEAEIAKLQEGEKKDEEKEKKPPAEEMPPEDEEKKKLAEAEKEKEKETAEAKSVAAAKDETKEEAEHSGVDDDIRRAMAGMKKARELGDL